MVINRFYDPARPNLTGKMVWSYRKIGHIVVGGADMSVMKTCASLWQNRLVTGMFLNRIISHPWPQYEIFASLFHRRKGQRQGLYGPFIRSFFPLL